MSSFAASTEAAPCVSLLSQATYDSFFSEIFNENGGDFDDAMGQIKDIFDREGTDLTNIFIYRNEKELVEKEKYTKSCLAIERVLQDKDAFVNANFAIQGLTQCLSKPIDEGETNYIAKMTWKLIEARRLPSTLIKLLAVKEDDEDDEKMKTGEEDDDDDDDEDEANLAKTKTTLEFLLFLATGSASKQSRPGVRKLDVMFTLSSEELELLLKRLDEDMAEEPITELLVLLFKALLGVASNKETMKALPVVALLDLAIKMNKRNDALVALIDVLLSML